MQVVILCGGRGTRLGAETEIRPKPMVEIGSKPILWHIMKYYAHFGHTEFILCLGYKGGQIRDYFLNYELNQIDLTLNLDETNGIHQHSSHSEKGWKITFANTGRTTMTGNRVKQIEKYIDSDTFMLTYGDGVCNVDLHAVEALHQRQGRDCTVTAVHPPARFGELRLTEQGDRVAAFAEKKQTEQGWINGGFFIFDRRLFDYLDDDGSLVLEREPLSRLAAAGQMTAYRHDGFWQCMDTVREMDLLRTLWDSGQAPWKVW